MEVMFEVFIKDSFKRITQKTKNKGKYFFRAMILIHFLNLLFRSPDIESIFSFVLLSSSSYFDSYLIVMHQMQGKCNYHYGIRLIFNVPF